MFGSWPGHSYLFFLLTFPTLTSLPPSFIYEDPCSVYTGWVHLDDPYLKILNLITSANSLLPCKVTFTGSCNLDINTLGWWVWGTIILPTTAPRREGGISFYCLFSHGRFLLLAKICELPIQTSSRKPSRLLLPILFSKFLQQIV